jgi:hypothetical protein
METNIKEYAAIALSLSTYEERVKLHQAEVALKRAEAIKRLLDLGVSEEDIAAIERGS